MQYHIKFYTNIMYGSLAAFVVSTTHLIVVLIKTLPSGELPTEPFQLTTLAIWVISLACDHLGVYLGFQWYLPSRQKFRYRLDPRKKKAKTIPEHIRRFAIRIAQSFLNLQPHVCIAWGLIILLCYGIAGLWGALAAVMALDVEITAVHAAVKEALVNQAKMKGAIP